MKACRGSHPAVLERQQWLWLGMISTRLESSLNNLLTVVFFAVYPLEYTFYSLGFCNLLLVKEASHVSTVIITVSNVGTECKMRLEKQTSS